MKRNGEPTVGRCSIPDCGRYLTIKNKTGRCFAHQHEPGYCHCYWCDREAHGGRTRKPPEYLLETMNCTITVAGSDSEAFVRRLSRSIAMVRERRAARAAS